MVQGPFRGPSGTETEGHEHTQLLGESISVHWVSGAAGLSLSYASRQIACGRRAVTWLSSKQSGHTELQAAGVAWPTAGTVHFSKEVSRRAQPRAL